MSIGAGAIWGHVYNEVTTRGGRYVQGGGCMTVGVAGLIQGGGFGSWSKAYGMAAASLLEAEIVTADGDVKIANACSNPDLFWALKGGGGGFGVVTRVTLRTHELPKFFGVVSATVKATSDDAYRRLVAKILEFYREALFNPNWGEQIVFAPGGIVAIFMVFQGLDQQQAEAVWRPFFDWAAAAPQDFSILSAPKIGAVPAQHFWDPAVLRKIPDLVIADDREGAPADNIFWATNLGEAGRVWYAYQSAWLPASLLEVDRRESLADALFTAAKHRGVSLHVNKGLAGARANEIAGAKDTAMNPAVVDAFALAISAAGGSPAYPGVQGHEPDDGSGAVSGRGSREDDERNPQAPASRRLLCLGDRLFPAELAGGVLGRKLCAASRGQGQIRSRRPLLPPSWRRQRGLERGRIHAVEWKMTPERRRRPVVGCPNVAKGRDPAFQLFCACVSVDYEGDRDALVAVAHLV